MRIVHVFRAPVGGLFRHVIDLATEQAARGHDVGVFCDATFAGERNEKLLAELAGRMTLGVARAPMRRNPHWTDITAFAAMGRFCRDVRADVMHGHGSKGGLYARLGASLVKHGPIRAYTPHGGSLNYRPGSAIHRAYMLVERLLERGSDAFLFESRFIAERYREYVGETSAVARVVLNGLHAGELQPVTANPNAVDFLYIGEFRFAKGVDNLLVALSGLRRPDGARPKLLLVGQGPDEAALVAKAAGLGVAGDIEFRKPMAAREAFALARIMVVPSRFESMPYVVIEAAGARMPLVSTDVGGIPEIFGVHAGRLVRGDDVKALEHAMASMLAKPEEARLAEASVLASHIEANFCVQKMASTVLDAYADAAARRSGTTTADADGPQRAPAE